MVYVGKPVDDVAIFVPKHFSTNEINSNNNSWIERRIYNNISPPYIFDKKLNNRVNFVGR